MLGDSIYRQFDDNSNHLKSQSSINFTIERHMLKVKWLVDPLAILHERGGMYFLHDSKLVVLNVHHVCKCPFRPVTGSGVGHPSTVIFGR